jgi:hypothetical protein
MKSNNRVYIDENDFIHCVWEGDQTVENIQAFGVEIFRLIAQLEGEHKPIRVLNEIDKVGKETPATRKAIVNGIKKSPAETRAAFVTNKILMRAAANFITLMSGRKAYTSFFATVPEAMAFLKRPDGE